MATTVPPASPTMSLHADIGVPSDPTTPSASVLQHIVDVHCHPTDAGEISDASMRALGITVCAMSTYEGDQGRVRNLASRYPDKVVPCFGYHPWFSHFISTEPSASEGDASTAKEWHYRRLFLPVPSPELEAQFAALLLVLPPPRPLSAVLAELRANLVAFPRAMLGEVGLDRAFRVPVDYFAASRVLTPFTIPLAHQETVMEAQLLLAVELGRNVSVHSVKAQQATVELLNRVRARVGDEKWMKMSVDMHSCGLSAQSWRDLEKRHPNVFLSLSTVINHKHAGHRALIAACAPDRILVESDYNDINMCAPQTWDMVKIVADVNGWVIETEWWYDDAVELDSQDSWGVVKRLEQNWLRFKNGNHQILRKRKPKKRPDYDSENSDGFKAGD